MNVARPRDGAACNYKSISTQLSCNTSRSIEPLRMKTFSAIIWKENSLYVTLLIATLQVSSLDRDSAVEVLAASVSIKIERWQIITANIFKTRQITTKQSKWIDKTAGKRTNVYVCFGGVLSP